MVYSNYASYISKHRGEATLSTNNPDKDHSVKRKTRNLYNPIGKSAGKLFLLHAPVNSSEEYNLCPYLEKWSVKQP